MDKISLAGKNNATNCFNSSGSSSNILQAMGSCQKKAGCVGVCVFDVVVEFRHIWMDESPNRRITVASVV